MSDNELNDVQTEETDALENKENLVEKKNTRFTGKIGKFVSGVAEKTKDVATKSKDTVVEAIDKNDDGKIGLDDFGIEQEDLDNAKENVQKIADKAGESVKAGTDFLNKTLKSAKLELEIKTLRPVFLEDFQTPNGKYCTKPHMLRIVEKDRKHSESVVCEGSLGYISVAKDIEILNIFEENAADLGITFFPDIRKSFYYIDPFVENSYILLDEYFVRMRKVRVSELEMVAKDLGAKYFKIAFSERKKTLVSEKTKGNINVAKNKAAASVNVSNNEFTNTNIEAEERFSGHHIPIRPKLVYFKNDSDIESLVDMRMDESKENKIEAKTYSLEYSRTSAIKQNEAASIDAMLKQLKLSGTASIESEVQNEMRTVLLYSIEF